MSKPDLLAYLLTYIWNEVKKNMYVNQLSKTIRKILNNNRFFKKIVRKIQESLVIYYHCLKSSYKQNPYGTQICHHLLPGECLLPSYMDFRNLTE